MIAGDDDGNSNYRFASSKQIRLEQYKLIVNDRRDDVFEMMSS